jgi:hypothetical protein
MNKIEPQYVTFTQAKLLKEKGFDEEAKMIYYHPPKIDSFHGLIKGGPGYGRKYNYYKDKPKDGSERIHVTTQSLLQNWIRETRGVHIEIHRNASGWFWSMCKSENGTYLGYSKFSGPNDSGVWDEHDDALENALQIQLTYDLPNSLNVIKHWGNYVELAIEELKA